LTPLFRLKTPSRRVRTRRRRSKTNGTLKRRTMPLRCLKILMERYMMAQTMSQVTELIMVLVDGNCTIYNLNFTNKH